MKTTFLETLEDMRWLHEVHGIPCGFACAILKGNEDCPESVECFARNSVHCQPVVYRLDPESLKLVEA